MPFKITKGKDIISRIKRKLVKEKNVKLASIILYFGRWPSSCKNCIFLHKDCSSVSKRRKNSIRWLEKHGYEVDLSYLIKKIDFNKKYIFDKENIIESIIENFNFRDDFYNKIKECRLKHKVLKVSIERATGEIFFKVRLFSNNSFLDYFFISKDTLMNDFIYLLEEEKRNIFQEEMEIWRLNN